MHTAGTVESASVVEDRDTGRSRGFGFVEMSSKEEGAAAIAQFNGKEVNGRALKVNEAKPRENRGGGGGRWRRRRRWRIAAAAAATVVTVAAAAAMAAAAVAAAIASPAGKSAASLCILRISAVVSFGRPREHESPETQPFA